MEKPKTVVKRFLENVMHDFVDSCRAPGDPRISNYCSVLLSRLSQKEIDFYIKKKKQHTLRRPSVIDSSDEDLPDLRASASVLLKKSPTKTKSINNNLLVNGLPKSKSISDSHKSHERQGSPPNSHKRQGSPPNSQKRHGSPPNSHKKHGSSSNAHKKHGSSPNDHRKHGSSSNEHKRLGSPPSSHESPPSSHSKRASSPSSHSKRASSPSLHSKRASPPSSRSKRASSPSSHSKRASSPNSHSKRASSPSSHSKHAGFPNSHKKYGSSLNAHKPQASNNFSLSNEDKIKEAYKKKFCDSSHLKQTNGENPQRTHRPIKPGRLGLQVLTIDDQKSCDKGSPDINENAPEIDLNVSDIATKTGFHTSSKSTIQTTEAQTQTTVIDTKTVGTSTDPFVGKLYSKPISEVLKLKPNQLSCQSDVGLGIAVQVLPLLIKNFTIHKSALRNERDEVTKIIEEKYNQQMAYVEKQCEKMESTYIDFLQWQNQQGEIDANLRDNILSTLKKTSLLGKGPNMTFPSQLPNKSVLSTKDRVSTALSNNSTTSQSHGQSSHPTSPVLTRVIIPTVSEVSVVPANEKHQGPKKKRKVSKAASPKSPEHEEQVQKNVEPKNESENPRKKRKTGINVIAEAKECNFGGASASTREPMDHSQAVPRPMQSLPAPPSNQNPSLHSMQTMTQQNQLMPRMAMAPPTMPIQTMYNMRPPMPPQYQMRVPNNTAQQNHFNVLMNGARPTMYCYAPEYSLQPQNQQIAVVTPQVASVNTNLSTVSTLQVNEPRSCFSCGTPSKIHCCGLYSYCSDKCQAHDWARHGPDCKRNR